MAPVGARTLEVLQTPVRLAGRVVHGFGRGSAQLGFPTANLAIRWDACDGDRAHLNNEERTVLTFAETARTGIYAAWAKVCDGPDQGVYKVAMSVGWNPHFQDLKRQTIEAWLLHDFADDFYDATLKVVVVAYVRDEAKFDSLDELIAEIRADGDFCERTLDERADLNAFKDDPFFSSAAALPTTPSSPPTDGAPQ
mmetsp:Transcript_15282/g.61443  ORF Transcript_15282/g.61443 Transcript_15282/m.61443 type:complete len:196 (-) Transcript_15282:298-885(-)